MSKVIHILLVDSDEDDRMLAASMLNSALPQATITEACDALGFAQAYASGPFDLAIAELELGWSAGIELLASIKRTHPTCATVLFSASTVPSDLRHLSVDASLPKSSGGFVALPKLAEQLLASGKPDPSVTGPGDQLLRALPLPVFELHPNGIVRNGNPALADAFGCADVSELIGRPFPEFVLLPEQRREVQQALANGHALDLPDVTLGTQDELSFSSRVRMFPDASDAQNGTTQGLLVLTRGALADAARSPEDADLRSQTPTQTNERPRDSVHDRVSASLFRELQDPLELLRQYSQALIRSFEAKPESQAENMLERIGTISDRVQGMIHAMLRFTASNPQHVPRFDEVSLSNVLADALRELDSDIAATGAKITASELPTVIGERGALTLLVHQLLDNSLKFRHTNTPVIRIGAEERANDWLITFQDNGLGIPSGEDERAFDLFVRLHDVEVYPGEGIGLSLCRDVAHNHGGDIWAERVEPRGTLFRITLSKHLPVEPPAEPPADGSDSTLEGSPLGKTG